MDFETFFRATGILGLLLITGGVLTRNNNHQNYFFIAGSAFMLVYSWFLGDTIFLILQGVFILASIYDLSKGK
jgi:lipid-A-disaccharide synthase-like uncharacterized protein